MDEEEYPVCPDCGERHPPKLKTETHFIGSDKALESLKTLLLLPEDWTAEQVRELVQDMSSIGAKLAEAVQDQSVRRGWNPICGLYVTMVAALTIAQQQDIREELEYMCNLVQKGAMNVSVVEVPMGGLEEMEKAKTEARQAAAQKFLNLAEKYEGLPQAEIFRSLAAQIIALETQTTKH